MGLFNSIQIGFVLTPGCRVADILGLDAVLRFHPRNKMHFIAERKGIIKGKSKFGLETTTTFADCPRLDVLIVGEMTNKEVNQSTLWEFIAQKSVEAKYVIGVSNGVWALHKAGVIKNEKVTADRTTLQLLKRTNQQIVDERKCVISNKFITAGPSTGGIEAAFTLLQKTRGNWLTKLAEFNLEYDAQVQHPLDKDVKLEQPPLPKPLKIGVFTGTDLYIPDVVGATDIFGSIPNAAFFYFAPKKGISKSMIGFGPNMIADTTLQECPDLDVMIFGASHPRYLKDKKVLDFILRQEKKAAAIITVCAGTFVVGSTGLLEGKEAATNYHQIVDLPKIGVCPTNNEVAIDGKYFSAGPAVGSYQVAITAVEQMIGKEWAQYIEHEILEFSPNPVFGTNPKNASRSIVKVSKILSFVIQKIYRPYLKKGYYAQGIKPHKQKDVLTVSVKYE